MWLWSMYVPTRFNEFASFGYTEEEEEGVEKVRAANKNP